jgi:hypothetical protein
MVRVPVNKVPDAGRGRRGGWTGGRRLRISADIALSLLQKMLGGSDRPTQETEVFLQSWHPEWQLRGPGCRGSHQHRPEPDKDAEEQADEKQRAEYPRHAQTLQQSHCRIKDEHEDEGENDGKDDLPPYVSAANIANMNKPPWKKVPKSDGSGISVRSAVRKLISGGSRGSPVTAAWVERMPGISSALVLPERGFGGWVKTPNRSGAAIKQGACS